MDLKLNADDVVVSLHLKDDARIDAAVSSDGSIAGIEVEITGPLHVFSADDSNRPRTLTIATNGKDFSRLTEALVTADPKRPAFTAGEWLTIARAMRQSILRPDQPNAADRRAIATRIEEAYGA